MTENNDYSDEEETAKLLIRIRRFEEALDPLFEQGVISGTFHRCIGQEATAVGVCTQLDQATDYVVSNHRNHGHYLAFTGDFEGLLEELKGSTDGVSGGRGGSQVIFGDHFVSNGILGSTISVAAGIALALKRDGTGGCVTCFVGDGALCEGTTYEAMNMASLWSLPILFVVEHNHMAQSAKTRHILAGSIPDRFRALEIETQSIQSTDVFELESVAKTAVASIKTNEKPFALVVDAARLCAHSKGDDPRTDEELDPIRARDPLRVLQEKLSRFDELENEATQSVLSLTGLKQVA